MKKFVLFFGLFSSCQNVLAAERVPVSVLEFKDKTEVHEQRCEEGWWYWKNRLGSAFKEMLISELASDTHLMILERQTINKVYGVEHGLINSSADTTTLKPGQFKKARFTLVGSVSEFEMCAEKEKSDLDVGAVGAFFGLPIPAGSVGFGNGTAKGKATIDVRIIDVETGEIISSTTHEGATEEKNFSLKLLIFNKENESKQPVAKAAREAIRKAAGEVKSVLASR